MPIILDELAPITNGAGFIDVPLAAIEDRLLPWYQSLGNHTTMETLCLPLKDALMKLEPLSSSAYKELWIETRSRWLASFSNNLSGGGGRVSYLARLCKSYAVTIRCTPFTRSTRNPEEGKGTWGSVQFELFGPEPNPILNGIRAVAVANDGGSWVFHASGEVQPFEETGHYSAPRIRDRFTPGMLEAYCRAIGIDAFDESFYGPRAFLVETSTLAWKKQPRTMTLLDRRRELGLGGFV